MRFMVAFLSDSLLYFRGTRGWDCLDGVCGRFLPVHCITVRCLYSDTDLLSFFSH